MLNQEIEMWRRKENLLLYGWLAPNSKAIQNSHGIRRNYRPIGNQSTQSQVQKRFVLFACLNWCVHFFLPHPEKNVVTEKKKELF